MKIKLNKEQKPNYKSLFEDLVLNLFEIPFFRKQIQKIKNVEEKSEYLKYVQNEIDDILMKDVYCDKNDYNYNKINTHLNENQRQALKDKTIAILNNLEEVSPKDYKEYENFWLGESLVTLIKSQNIIRDFEKAVNNMKINLPMKVQFIGKVDKFDIIKDELKLIQDPDEQIIYLINKKVECLQKKDGWEIELGLSLPEKIQLEIDKRKEIMKIKKQIVNKPKIIKSLAKRIFISHGRSHEWRKVQAYIEKTLEYETLELAQEPNLGRTVLQKLSEESDKCGYAVIVMTGDDIVDGDLNRARENVIHEIGYFQGKFGLKNICLLYEEGTNIPSNIKGLVYIPFAKDKVENTFGDLTKELNAFMKSK